MAQKNWCEFIFLLAGRGAAGELAGRGRQPRPVADSLLSHALNRGPVCFVPAADRAFLKALAQTPQRYPFRRYGSCLMNNHFHLLLQLEEGQSISRVLQSLTGAPTGHSHRGHGTVGHVCQGRLKSPLVQADDRALTVLRYREANPLRAGRVADLADHPWSSDAAHALGQADARLSPLPCWERGGATAGARPEGWRTWVQTPRTDKEVAALRRSVTSGRPYGEASGAKALEQRLRLRFSERGRGRPRQKPAGERNK